MLDKSLHCCNKILPYFRKRVSIHFLFLKYQNHFDMKKSPFKNSENSLGEGGLPKTPWNRKSWGVGGDANQRVFRGGGMDIFWNHTFRKYPEGKLHVFKRPEDVFLEDWEWTSAYRAIMEMYT